MKQFAVIGLGSFGYYLASQLYEKGHDVLAIDRLPGPVQDIRDLVTQSVVADSTDAKALAALGVGEMDAVVVCMGTRLNDSILTTLNLKEMGVKEVHAKAHSEAHGRILEKIGASQVLFPERDQAIALAEQLHMPNMVDYLPFSDDHSIVQVEPPKSFIGKSLKELALTNRFGIQVVAIQELVPEKLHMIPKADAVIKDSDMLILLGPNDAIARLRTL